MGYIACFLPKVLKDCGNGAHAHLSLWRNGKDIVGEQNSKYGLHPDA